MSKQESLRTQIALGWVSLLLILAIMLEVMIVQSSFANDNFTALKHDPSRGGLRIMLYFIGLYALMPILVFSVDAARLRALRWLVVGVAALNLLFMVLHHLSHWLIGQRTTFSSNILDFAYHLTALWVLYRSIQWSRREVPVQSAAPAITAATQQPGLLSGH